MTWRYLLILVPLATLACDESPTAPTSTTTTTPTTTTTTTPTAASPTTSDVFAAILPVGGSRFYSFTTSTYGTITLTLTSVGGTFVPSTVMVNLGLGQPSGTDCVTTTSINTAAGAAGQVTGVYAAGVYCAKVSDIGNLYAPASFSVTVAYP